MRIKASKLTLFLLFATFLGIAMIFFVTTEAYAADNMLDMAVLADGFTELEVEAQAVESYELLAINGRTIADVETLESLSSELYIPIGMGLSESSWMTYTSDLLHDGTIVRTYFDDDGHQMAVRVVLPIEEELYMAFTNAQIEARGGVDAFSSPIVIDQVIRNSIRVSAGISTNGSVIPVWDAYFHGWFNITHNVAMLVQPGLGAVIGQTIIIRSWMIERYQGANAGRPWNIYISLIGSNPSRTWASFEAICWSVSGTGRSRERLHYSFVLDFYGHGLRINHSYSRGNPHWFG